MYEYLLAINYTYTCTHLSVLPTSTRLVCGGHQYACNVNTTIISKPAREELAGGNTCGLTPSLSKVLIATLFLYA